MTGVTRLLTVVDIDGSEGDGADARQMSVSALHFAVLDDGRQLVLLDDRGWSASVRAFSTDGAPPPHDRRDGLRSIWGFETVESLEETARVVVGPDEPPEGRTHAEVEAFHWGALARVLRQQGVDVGAAHLSHLPHDVELSERLLARLSGARGGAG